MCSLKCNTYAEFVRMSGECMTIQCMLAKEQTAVGSNTHEILYVQTTSGCMHPNVVDCIRLLPQAHAHFWLMYIRDLTVA
jgi:hypothetical protein